MTDFAFLHGGGQGSWIWNETIAAIAMQSGGSAREARDRSKCLLVVREVGPAEGERR